MELRYVYRRVEDAIGSAIEVADSPHGRLTLQLRHLFREQRDIARHTGMLAMCMASLAGNDRMNVEAASNNVSELLDRSLYQEMPYLKPKKEEINKDKYAEYFKQLEEFTESLKKEKEKQAAEAADDSKQKTETA